MSYEIYSGKAIEKLNTEQKISVSDSKIMIMKDFVNETLTTFCKQSEEFSQAVVQGGSFIDCMKYVAKGVGRAISDIEAIEKAVHFYFPTATISLSMTIDTEGNNSLSSSSEEPKQEKHESTALSMSLDDLLGL